MHKIHIIGLWKTHHSQSEKNEVKLADKITWREKLEEKEIQKFKKKKKRKCKIF